MLNAEKIYQLLFQLVEDQEDIEITFTLKEKKEDRENEHAEI